MSIRKTDILDTDIVDAYELASDGYSYYLTTTLVSTDSLTQLITINYTSDGEGIFYSKDHPAQTGDIVNLSGTISADGYYTINQVLTDLTFTVNEPISSSIGGGIVFIYPSGASNVGFNSRGLTSTNADTIQDALRDVALVVDNIVINALSPTEHQTLRQLIHFIDEGPADGFASGAEKRITPTGTIFPTSIIWYIDNTLTTKIVEQSIIWTGIVPTTITWQVYSTDGITIVHTVSDNITYINNIFETSRTRTIT